MLQRDKASYLWCLSVVYFHSPSLLLFLLLEEVVLDEVVFHLLSLAVSRDLRHSLPLLQLEQVLVSIILESQQLLLLQLCDLVALVLDDVLDDEVSLAFDMHRLE